MVGRRILLAAGGMAVLAFFYELVATEFLFVNFLVAIVTYSAFLPVLLMDGRRLASRALLEKMLAMIAWMIAAQAAVGVTQAVYGASQTGSFGGANGDYVEGTIHPSLDAEFAFGNPMFACNMALMLLASLALPAALSRGRKLVLLAGTVALVLASVVHVLGFLVVSVVTASFLVSLFGKADGRFGGAGKVRARAGLALIVLTVSGLTYVALPGNIERVGDTLARAFDVDELAVPRSIMLYRVATELPAEEPLQPVIGVGPGQFCSRASLIVSGMYLGSPDSPKVLPLVSPRTTRLAADYCITLLLVLANSTSPLGSSEQPFFSVLSVYTETGFVGLSVLLVLVVVLLRQVIRRARQEPSVKTWAVLFAAGVLFVGLLGLQQNYWELPQAIFVGLLLLKVLHSNILYASAETGER